MALGKNFFYKILNLVSMDGVDKEVLGTFHDKKIPDWVIAKFHNTYSGVWYRMLKSRRKR